MCVSVCVWWLQDCRRLHKVALPTVALQVLSSWLKVTFYWLGHVRRRTAQGRGPRCGRYAGHQRCHLNAWDIMGWERSETCATCVLFLMWCIGVLYSSIGVGFFGQPEVRSGIFRSYMSKAIIRAPLMRWFWPSPRQAMIPMQRKRDWSACMLYLDPGARSWWCDLCKQAQHDSAISAT